jgi:predicted amidohydrolase YtcJ
MKVHKLFLLLIITLFVLGSCKKEYTSQNPKADLIIHNAHIVTVNDSFDIAHFMAIKDGKILFVGDEKNIELWKGAYTQVIDLRGKTVMPGFVEPHSHPIASAALSNWIDVSGLKHKTAQSALKELKKAVQNTPKGEWILAFGWDMMLIDGAFPLTKDYIDKNISNEHPVWIMMQSMHTHYLNTMALDKGGITKNTPNPIAGGYYEKDKKGNLTGIATESATVAPLMATLRVESRQEAKNQIYKMYQRYNAVGITTVGATGLIDIMPGHKAEDLCKEIANDGQATLRLYYYDIGLPSLQDPLPPSENWMIRQIGQKYWVDGSPYTGSMLMREPYLKSELNQQKLNIAEGEYGHLMFPLPFYKKLFKQAHDLGWQISIHSQGDSATSIALDAISSVLDMDTLTDQRHRMEHLALVTDDQLGQMKQLGMTPSFHINHIYYYGDFLKSSIIGPSRVERMMPLAEAINKGHKVSLHSDSPMYPPNPLLTVETAITRRTSSGQVIGTTQAIDIQEALKAITINPTWQMHAEDKIGSLEIGKQADFVILDQNPLTESPTEISKIKVMATYLNGRKVF